MDDLISRQAAIDAVENLVSSMSVCINVDEYNGMRDMKYRALKAINKLPSAQPDLDSAYTEGYTQAEAKYRKMWDEMQAAQQWIPFKTRPLTEEEKEEHPEWDFILDCPLPDDGQRILVNIKYKGHEAVQLDEYYDDDGSYLDSGYEIGTEANAWMPLPEPWKGEQDG